MRNRNFHLLLSGQLVSQIGDKFHMLAISLWVLKTTGSTAKMGAVLAASLIPSLVTGFFSGAIIDRYDRKKIIVGTDLLRGLILAAFAALFYFGWTGFYLLLSIQVLLSVNAAFFDPAIPAVIAQVVDRKDLARANSRHQLVNSMATIAGACLGGIVTALFGYFWAFAINALSFLASALFECFLKLPPVPNASEKNRGPAGLISDLSVGYRYIASNTRLMVLLVLVGTIHFFVGSAEVFMPVLADAVGGNGARNLGFFQTAFGTGTIVAAAVLSLGYIVGRETAVLFGSIFVMGALYAVAPWLIETPAAPMAGCLFLFFFFGGGIICAGISFRTLLQQMTDNRLAGRVFAVAGSVGNASIPAAMIAYGWWLEKWDASVLLPISGMALMAMSIMSSFIYGKASNAGKTEVSPEPLA